MGDSEQDSRPVKTIIAVDRVIEPLLRQESFLRRTAHRVVRVKTNREVVEAHRALKANLLIAALHSPEMGGEALCALVRKDKALKSVSIMVVGKGGEQDIERCTAAGANACFISVEKPDELLGRAQQLLNVARRLDFRAPVSIKVEGKHMDMPFIGFAENISASGMLLTTEKPLAEGERATCSFFLTPSAHIIVNARIVRANTCLAEYDSCVFGVQFEGLDSHIISIIEAYVEDEFRRTKGGGR